MCTSGHCFDNKSRDDTDIFLNKIITTRAGFSNIFFVGLLSVRVVTVCCSISINQLQRIVNIDPYPSLQLTNFEKYQRRSKHIFTYSHVHHVRACHKLNMALESPQQTDETLREFHIFIVLQEKYLNANQ